MMPPAHGGACGLLLLCLPLCVGHWLVPSVLQLPITLDQHTYDLAFYRYAHTHPYLFTVSLVSSEDRQRVPSLGLLLCVCLSCSRLHLILCGSWIDPLCVLCCVVGAAMGMIWRVSRGASCRSTCPPTPTTCYRYHHTSLSCSWCRHFPEIVPSPPDLCNRMRLDVCVWSGFVV